jgi:hypothetical protein
LARAPKAAWDRNSYLAIMKKPGSLGIERALFFAVAVLAGCARPAPSLTVSQPVGPEGGTIALGDGTRLDIPPGALAGTQTITARPVEVIPPPDLDVVGPVYLFGPEGLQFQKPIRITLAFDPSLVPAGSFSEDIVIFTAPANTTQYSDLGTRMLDDTHVRAETMHFSVFGPGVPRRPKADLAMPPADLAMPPADLAMPPVADLAMPAADLANTPTPSPTPSPSPTPPPTDPVDMARPFDLAQPLDMVVTPAVDLGTAVDLAAPGSDLAVSGADLAPTFDMTPPAPVITLLTPDEVHAGSADLYLFVDGVGLDPFSVIQVDGNPLDTSLSLGRLLAILPKALLASPATLAITVTAAGGTSAPKIFTITASGNPPPTVASVTPASIALGDSLEPNGLVITGTGFVEGSRVFAGGIEVHGMMTVKSPTEIALDWLPILGAAGSYPVVVQTPGPGGGASDGSVVFTVTGTNPMPDFTVSPSQLPLYAHGQLTLTATSPSHDFTSATTITVSDGTTTRQAGQCYSYGPNCFADLYLDQVSHAGTLTITATTPGPGGGSGSATITVADGNVLVPNEVRAGTGDLPLVVWGGLFFPPADLGSPDLFQPTSVMNVNGIPVATRLVDSNHLLGLVPAALLASTGSRTVTVASGDQTSAPLTLQVVSTGNPLPTVSSLEPASTPLGNTVGTLVLHGSNFLSGARVFVDGVEANFMSPPSVSPDQISAFISPDLIGAAGSYPVLVLNPAPGGGTNSQGVDWVVTGENPAPSFTAAPSKIPVRSYGGLTLRAAPGHNFTSKTTLTATWGGNSASIGTCQGYYDVCSAYLPIESLQQAGTVTVTAVTPAPGGGTSSASLTIVDGLVLLPEEVHSGSGDFTLGVWGGLGSGGSSDLGAPSGFSPSSVVKANGSPVPTTFHDPFLVGARLPASLLADPGSLAITVTTGGVTSPPAPLAVVASGNPVPSVLAVTPSSVPLGTFPQAGIVVEGSDFAAGARLFFGAAELEPGSFIVSDTQILIPMPFNLLYNLAGSFAVVVQNPAPGGGASDGSVLFTIQ